MRKKYMVVFILLLTALPMAGCGSARTPDPTPEPTLTQTAQPTATATVPSGPVHLEYLGHASFELTAGDGTRIVMDPYKTGQSPIEIWKYPPGIVADAVTISHFHPDHDGIENVGGKPQEIYKTGAYQVGAVKITGYKSDHGYLNGEPNGDNTVFVFETGGIKIVHMGAAGVVTQSDILAAIQGADVVIIDAMGTSSHPVPEMMKQLRDGGVRMVIPSHNSITATTIYYGSITVDDFVKLLASEEKVNRSGLTEITVTPGMPVQVLIMTPLALSTQ